jgi:hypothetical protein
MEILALPVSLSYENINLEDPMNKAWSAIAVLALAAGGEKVAWEKPDNALGVSAATGKLVCWYFLSGEMVKGTPQGSC